MIHILPTLTLAVITVRLSALHATIGPEADKE